MSRKDDVAMHKVLSRIERPDPELVARYRHAKFEVVAELVSRTQLMDPAIRPLAEREMRFVGPAVTVSTGRANTFMSIAAVGVAQPGDVILVAAGGDCSEASWGGGLALSARSIGCAGVVVDGAVIDTSAIIDREVPVMCRGATYAHSPEPVLGSVNVPVSCGGVIVNPGDLVLAEMDGVIVVPREDVEAVLVQAEIKSEMLRGVAATLQKERSTIFARRGGRDVFTQAGIAWID